VAVGSSCCQLTCVYKYLIGKQAEPSYMHPAVLSTVNRLPPPLASFERRQAVMRNITRLVESTAPPVENHIVGALLSKSRASFECSNAEKYFALYSQKATRYL
jgi:hypothetical protein